MVTEYLFMAGEYRVSMPLVFRTTNWSHTMSQSRLALADGQLRYRNETLKGVIHYANCEDSALERANLESIRDSGVRCWPDPEVLLRMLNRHEVMAECGKAGLLTSPNVVVTTVHNVMSALIGQNDYNLPIPKEPFVVKTGNDHRGLGKYLSNEDWAEGLNLFDIVTVEPFYTGRSIRVLLMGDAAFGIEIKNESNWIKNAPGAEAESLCLGDFLHIIPHAEKVAAHFGLDCAGIDYILEDDGTFHFLEANQYPGLATLPEVEEEAKRFLKKKMDEVENA